MPATNQRRIFITGTDTDVGKTLVTCAMIRCLQNVNQTVMAIKPVAAGSEMHAGQLKNSDALQMQQHLNQSVDYPLINPVTLKSAIAPHIAAREEQVELSVEVLSQQCQLAQYDSDFLLVEGAGGWQVPLNQQESLADFAKREKLDVVLVVGMKLGCINHALLTVESIKSHELSLVGWVASSVTQKMNRYQQNLEFLGKAISAPLLGAIPHIQPSDELSASERNTQIVQTATSYVNITPLI